MSSQPEYAGNVAPTDAYAALRSDPDAVLVDVRTTAEWSYVGVPDLSEIGKQVVCVQWQTFPDGTQNAGFLDELGGLGVQAGAPVYFLCRSGVRSKAAAVVATQAGLGPAYNVTDGFEGPHDDQGHRSVRGWKADGLPWRQG